MTWINAEEVILAAHHAEDLAQLDDYEQAYRSLWELEQDDEDQERQERAYYYTGGQL